MPSEDLLSATQLLSLCHSLSPSSASLSSPSQVVLLLVHSIHSSLSFRLIDPKPQQEDKNELPQDWEKNSNSNNGFKYKHDQSSLEFIISVVDLGDKLLIVGNAVNNARSSSFEILKTDYFSPTSLPSTSEPLSLDDLSSTNPFSTEKRLEDLIYLYRLNVLQKLVPGLSKTGYSELPDSTSTSTTSTSSGRLAGTRDYLPDRGGPLGVYPDRSQPRGENEDDPLRIPGSGGRGRGGGRAIGEIGRNDLEPLGGLTGTFGGGPGGIQGLPGSSEGGGGMFMGPDHPLFRERFSDDGIARDRDGGGRRWGGDGFLPSIGAPPGARFDPIGPENGPPGSTGPSRGLPQGTFGGGGRQAHPDMEQPGPEGFGGFGGIGGRGGGIGGRFGGGGGGSNFGNMFE
ncbi:hypothetical protein JCM5350_008139 [Sporobolomyces pararoseus]